LKKTLIGIALLAATQLVLPVRAGHFVTLDMLGITNATTAKGKATLNRLCVGGDMHINGTVYWRGFGVAAPSRIVVPLGGGAEKMDLTIGMADGREGGGTAEFKIWGDGKLLFSSGKVKYGDPARKLELGLDGVREMVWELTDAGDGNVGDLGCWASPGFIFKDGSYPPNDVRNYSPQLGILTPPVSAAPRINGPTVIGVRPGRQVFHRLGVTGEQPLRISVDSSGLLQYDPKLRLITGRIDRPGSYDVRITATNAKGTAERQLTVKVGETISLTPAMGWNSWNCFTEHVTQEKVESAAEAMVSTGLADHGWQYIVTDDYWANSDRYGKEDETLRGPARAADGTINANSRFPSMRLLAERIHAKGLKAGLYSAPGKITCGFCTGSWEHEEQDAKTFADWGFDFLKYDWCYYGAVAMGTGLDHEMYPYLMMGKALRTQARDIVFSLCQYGRGNVSAWGKLAYGHSWRTTGDMQDTWDRISRAIEQQKKLFFFSQPGAFNDPDMLCIGKMNFNRFMGSRLAPNEQYTHMSIWALVASPLMIGCDMTRLDDFTYSLLTNDEVIDIDQDSLGLGAGCVAEGAGWEVWARPLADGSYAVGLYNKDVKPQTVPFEMSRLGLEGVWRLRDVWRQSDIGTFRGGYRCEVLGHATTLLRVFPVGDARLTSRLADIRDNAWMLMRSNDMKQK